MAFLAAAALTCGLAILPAGTARAADSRGDAIASRDIAYEVAADGTATVTDTVQYTFGDNGQDRHGIYLDYVIRQDYDNDRYRLYPFELQSVQSPTGAATKVKTEEDGPLVRLQIGDEKQTVQGTQTYVIRYTVKGIVNAVAAAGKNPPGEEVYITPLSDSAGVPTDRATVSITGPAPAGGSVCYQGRRGSETRCSAQAGATSRFTANNLGAQQAMSVVASFPVGTFTNTAPILRDGRAASGGGVGENMPVAVAKGLSTLGYGAGVLVPLVTLVLMALLVRRRGRDEYYAGLTPGLAPTDGTPGTTRRGAPGPVAVRFTPPDHVTPGLIGTIIDERADTIDVSATVIDLAARGFLTLEESEGEPSGKPDWRLIRNPRADLEQLRPYERRVYDGLFESGDDVIMSELRNHFATTLELAKRGMYREVVERGWFRQSPATTRRRWFGLAIAVAVIGAVSLFMTVLASPSIDTRSGIGFGIPSGVALGCGLLIAATVIFLLGKQMPAKTAAGSAVNAQAAGFRQYLETAEASQIRFEEAASIFSRYLPYAIVFGCAERWAALFKEVAESAQLQGVPIDMPTWYLFAGMNNIGSFGSIADAMGDFSSAAASTFTSTPGASGQSGMPGSGGGGFAGGGGFGGGSVGSW